MLPRRALLAAAPAALLPRSRPADARTVLAATPIDRLDLPWWRARHAAVLDRLRQGGADLLFLGDSITQNWEKRGPPDWLDFAPVWDRYYGDRRAVNLGFVGDTTASLLWRIENGEVAGIAPKVAVVLIGANNLGRVHWSAEDTLAGIQAILAALRARLPATRILLLGILPSGRSAWATQTTLEVNRTLAARYATPGAITFFDPRPVFARDGVLDRALFYDPLGPRPGAPLHPTAQGQARLAAAIEPVLSRLLGDRDHRPAG